MKRVWKYILLVFVLLVVSIGGYGIYIFKFKEYDVADPEVEEIIEDPYVITLPDGTEIVVDKEGNIIEERKDEPAEENSDGAQNEDTQSEDPTPSENDPNQVTGDSEQQRLTVSEIKEKYIPSLKELENQANSNLDALIQKAYDEYSAKRANGESIDIGYFYNKYMGAANGLEARTDAAFNALMTIIENELEENGYSKAHAQSLRDDYNAAKEERRSNLLKKAKEYL
ncbi:hypothetical protein ACFPOH_05220 [Ureibacillus suwonensis]|uniref:Uncharacterized protein n=1 Tax=Ureibacillus suwonensis TaxID=313007 RepID=A0ABW0RAD1_9BACL